jgi:hypothetical protein
VAWLSESFAQPRERVLSLAKKEKPLLLESLKRTGDYTNQKQRREFNEDSNTIPAALLLVGVFVAVGSTDVLSKMQSDAGRSNYRQV